MILRPRGMTNEEYCLYCCQLLGAMYNVEMDVNFKEKTIDFKTTNIVIINTILDELDETFNKGGGK